MKSGVTPSASIALQTASTSTREPTQSLKPTGFPSASSRSCATNMMSFTRGMKRRMCRRADTLLADWHTSVAGNLLADLCGWEHTADAGLGALAQLDRDALDKVVSGLVRELIRIERAVFGAGSEIAGADLPYHVGATEMIGSQPTFARVVGEPTFAGAVVQRT